MSLTTGTTLGPYEIIGTLGAGGMGEVYRARDTRLGRGVAIKILPDSFWPDEDRVARLEREAKMLAALNHPHIASLHGFDQIEGRHFLVMELVEGETLADRICQGPMPVEQGLRFACQIAEALEAAHEKGVIHRDLKPANVKITPDEKIKVLDFGLAKAVESAENASNIANSPTLSMMATQGGIVLGTAAYMSPEQAKGLPADQRSDIFSFGTVLYEMLTGRQPFHGETAADVMASVLVREPDLGSLPPTLNPRIHDLLRRCLEKAPKRRWQAIGDVRAEIETILSLPPAVIDAGRTAAAARPLWKRALPPLAAAIGAGALTAAIAWTIWPAPAAPSITRFSLTLPPDQDLSGPNRQMVAMSPDGASFVYVANGRLYLRQMSDLEAKPIQGISSGQAVTNPAFSPDGRSIAFWSPDGTIKRIAVAGGATVTVCQARNPFGMTWDASGLVFAQEGGGILRVNASGGKPETLVATKPGEVFYGPQILPGGRTLLFSMAQGARSDLWDKGSIVVQTIGKDDRKVLLEGGADARYVPTGHIVYVLGGTMFAFPFDPRDVKPATGYVPVLEGVGRTPAAASGAAQFGFSTTGSLVYLPGPPGLISGQFDIALVDRKGAAQPLKLPPGNYVYPRVSPDGTQLAFGTDDGRDAVIWVYDLSGTSAMRRLTFGGNNRFPLWAADGVHVAFQSDREGDAGIFWQRADGTDPAERLTRADKDSLHTPESWSPSGEYLLYSVRKGLAFSLWTLSIRDRHSQPFGDVHSPAWPNAAFSPDGKWVAYAASKIGTNDTSIFVQPFPATGAKYVLFERTGDNPHDPLWSLPDGKELLYVPRVGGFEAVPVVTRPALAFGNPVDVPRTFPVAAPTTPRTFDMMRDGRIVNVVLTGQASATPSGRPQLDVVLNWFEELKARAAAVK